MQFGEAMKVALQSLWANKMRTILTMLGVVIGVASVIAVITLSNGAEMFVVKKIANHGSDTLTIQRINPVIFSGEEYLKQNKRKNIVYDDFLYRSLHVPAVSPSAPRSVPPEPSSTENSLRPIRQSPAGPPACSRSTT